MNSQRSFASPIKPYSSLKVGCKVKIIGGSTLHVGKEGIITKFRGAGKLNVKFEDGIEISFDTICVKTIKEEK